jgi:hypothetical protein
VRRKGEAELCLGLAEVGFYVLVQVGEGLAEGRVVALDAADEHGAFEVGDDVVGGCAHIDIGSDGAGFGSFFQVGAEHGLPVEQGFADAVAEDGVAVVGIHRSIENGASAGQAGAGDEVGDVLLDAVCVVGNFVEMDAAFGGGELPGVVEGFGGQLFFAFKVAVDAALFEAGGIHDGLDGAALIAALVEDGCGLGDDALAG